MTTTLPRAVQAQLEEVERIERELAVPPSEPAPEPDTPPTPEPAPEPQTPAPPSPPQEDLWEARYKSLKGMFDSKVPHLQQENQALKGQLDELSKRLDELVKAPKETPKSTSKVTQKDVDAFGDDLIDLIKRQAEEVAAEREARLHDEIKELKNRNDQLTKQLGAVAETQGQMSEQAFLGALGQRVPDWETVNVDPTFHAWLAEADPLSGLQRQKLLEDAVSQRDVARTAHLFTVWRPAPAPAPEPKPSAKEQLEKQIAPGTSKVTPQPAAEKRWSTQDIERFYTDLSKGVYAGRKDEAVKIEAEIDRAIAEGRISL